MKWLILFSIICFYACIAMRTHNARKGIDFVHDTVYYHDQDTISVVDSVIVINYYDSTQIYKHQMDSINEHARDLILLYHNKYSNTISIVVSVGFFLVVAVLVLITVLKFKFNEHIEGGD